MGKGKGSLTLVGVFAALATCAVGMAYGCFHQVPSKHHSKRLLLHPENALLKSEPPSGMMGDF